MLAFAADILLQSEFPEKELDSTRTRARAGLEEQRSDPDFLGRESFAKVIYGKHPAASVGLTRESLEKMTRDDLAAFHRANYVPDHAIIGVSGDITLAEARTKFEAALKGGRKAGKPRPGVVDPPDRRARKVSLVNQVGIGPDRRLRSASRRSTACIPTTTRCTVMNHILGGSNGRLFRELRESKGYTYGVYSGARALRYGATGAPPWTCEPTSPSRRCAISLAEIAKMRDEVVPADEFADAQRALTASFALSLENPAEMLNLYMIRQLYNYPADYWDRYTDRICRGDAGAGAGRGEEVSRPSGDCRSLRLATRPRLPRISSPSAPSKFLTMRESR